MSFEFDLGFLGGGQLARMSIQAAQRMGLRCFSLDPQEPSPASQVAPSVASRLDDASGMAEVFRRCERITLENEFIPVPAIEEGRRLAGREGASLLPGTQTLTSIQDKLRQRELLAQRGVPQPRAWAIQSESDLGHEFPIVLKSRFGGYDGKGTLVVHSRQEALEARPFWESGGWLAEEFVPFVRELAVMVVAAADGKTVCFPTMETVQTKNVCDLVFPCLTDGREVAVSACQALGGAGLYGVELFEHPDGRVLVNEVAPRPHNSGHYTLDWGGISQFEAHIRVVMGLPVPEPQGAPTCMANLLGPPGTGCYHTALAATLTEHPDVFVHWYGKSHKPERKLGHINAVGQHARDRAEAARRTFYEAWSS